MFHLNTRCQRMNFFNIIICFLLLISIDGISQTGFKKNDMVPNFNAPIILNHPSNTGNFATLSADITIIDFFGTWCAPCIKAIPHLNQLKAKYNNKLAIVLISTEDEIQLVNFLKKNSAIQFPIFVDKNEIISQQFMPPSYPYSVILNKSGRILSLTNATDIKEDSIAYWLSEQVQQQIPQTFITLNVDSIASKDKVKTIRSTNSAILLSQELLNAVRTNTSTQPLVEKLALIPNDSLQFLLLNDQEKKAFWINIYNAFILIHLKEKPESYQHRNTFYSTRNITIAHELLSFGDIEHGILRKSQVKWGLGHMNKLFPRKIEKTWRVDTVDFRIHFALNCGASSCPPIAFYDDLKIQMQLNAATASYLNAETKYDSATNIASVPQLLSWFRGDFGSKQKINNLLSGLHLISENATPQLKYAPYNWELKLNKFIN